MNIPAVPKAERTRSAQTKFKSTQIKSFEGGLGETFPKSFHPEKPLPTS